MTDEQFNLLMAAQLAQINLLRSIEANIGLIMRDKSPQQVIHPNWKEAQKELEDALNQWNVTIKTSSEVQAEAGGAPPGASLDFIAEEAGGKA
jgi:hypothetical protein